jgi:hypothetical protein
MSIMEDYLIYRGEAMQNTGKRIKKKNPILV